MARRAAAVVGETASARARATRWACPPDSCAGRTSACSAELEPVEQLRRPLRRRRARSSPAGPQAEGDVVPGRHGGEQQVVLEDHADRALLGGARCRARRRRASSRRASRGPAERQQPGEGAQRACLAGTVGTEQGEHVAGGHLQRDVDGERAALDDDVGVESSCAQPALAQAGQDRDRDDQEDQAQGDGCVRIVLQGKVNRDRHGLRACPGSCRRR